MEAFGPLLHRLVRAHGLTMAGFAERLGISASVLSRLRTGRRLPRRIDFAAWQQALALTDEEADALRLAAALAQAPEPLRRHLAESEAQTSAETDRRRQVERHYGQYRADNHYYDGCWLAYHRSFLNDGTIQRTMLRIAGRRVSWVAKQAGATLYSYVGEVDHFGDKVFIRLEEERGATEFAQVTLHALFAFQEPAFLYGLAAGISGTSIRQPHSYPAAGRIILLFSGREDHFRQDPDLYGALDRTLGCFPEAGLGPFWPTCLGDDAYLRACLSLKPREDLEAHLRRMISNQLGPGEQVLRAVF